LLAACSLTLALLAAAPPAPPRGAFPYPVHRRTLENGLQVVFVPYGHIKGKAMIIWLSLSHGGLLSNFFGGTGLRPERFFRQVR
jgi:hypothetical protein